jgi:hypothetical protein
MPKKNKKPVREMTTDEIAQTVFPKRVVKELRQLANPLKTSRALRKKSNK